jgi:hypothetical protein
MLDFVKWIKYAGEKKINHVSSAYVKVLKEKHLKHENINKEEASEQEFIYYLVHMRVSLILNLH